MTGLTLHAPYLNRKILDIKYHWYFWSKFDFWFRESVYSGIEFIFINDETEKNGTLYTGTYSIYQYSITWWFDFVVFFNLGLTRPLKSAKILSLKLTEFSYVHIQYLFLSPNW